MSKVLTRKRRAFTALASGAMVLGLVATASVTHADDEVIVEEVVVEEVVVEEAPVVAFGAPPAAAQEVDWTGNGTNDGLCNNIGDFGDLAPGPNQQGWLFILTSPFDGLGSTLTYAFDPSTTDTSVSGTKKGNGANGSYHYVVYTDIGAVLLSASATDGTANSVLTVSHCESGGGDEPGPPIITVQKSAAVTYDEIYTWTVVKNFVGITAGWGYANLTYNVDVTRTGPFPISGSYEVTGDIRVANIGETDANLDTLIDVLPGATCTVNGFTPGPLVAGGEVNVDYSCTVPGLPAGDAVNTATAGFSYGEANTGTESGTAPVDYDAATVDETKDATATLSDDKYPGITPSSYSDSGTSDDYTITGVTAGGTNCDPGYQNTATIAGDDTGAGGSDTETVKVCRTTGGRTIGYWANKGLPLSYAALNTGTATKSPLKTTYANVLGSNPPAGLTQSNLGKWILGANCSGDCKRMFQAQFFATALNAYHSAGGAYGNQSIVVPLWLDADGCATINELLAYGNTNFNTMTLAHRIALKSIYDAVNQDTGQGILCP